MEQMWQYITCFWNTAKWFDLRQDSLTHLNRTRKENEFHKINHELHTLLFPMTKSLFSRYWWVQFADTHLLEQQCLCQPTRRLRLCVHVRSGLQWWLPTGRGNQTQWGGLETSLWPLCYMLLQGTEGEHTLTNSLHFTRCAWKRMPCGLHRAWEFVSQCTQKINERWSHDKYLSWWMIHLQW